MMFSDGIRPGGDLTELDGSSSSSPSHHPPRKHHSRRSKKSHSHKVSTADVGKSLLPVDKEALPMVFGRGSVGSDEIAGILENTLQEPIPFVVNKNLVVHVKLINCKF